VKFNLYPQPWITIPILLLASFQASTQCSAPASLWLTPPQTSTNLVFKWSAVQSATQYQMRFWEQSNADDKTIVDNCGPAPFILRGLRKNSLYSVQVRSKCGNSYSSWGNPISSTTFNSSGSCNGPTGVVVSAGSSEISVTWTSTSPHTIRYRLGNSGDWLVPTGAMSATSSPFIISGLAPGSYQVQVKRHCSSTTSNPVQNTVVIAGGCVTPLEPNVTIGTTNAMVELPPMPGVIAYNIAYRPGTSGNWISVGNNVQQPSYNLNPPLLPASQYQVQIQAICSGDLSSFSAPTTFTTKPVTSGSCLANKNAGKYLSPSEVQAVDEAYNRPSPFSFGSMIGVNDGGLVFRSFQNVARNQITDLTTQFRNFHTMDEDFNQNNQPYDQSTKPKHTFPEGTPAFFARNKGFYTKYREHGFLNITGATELLQYWPQTWKEKIYRESDWSMSGVSGIRQSFANYTRTFIDELAPVNGLGNQLLVSNFQVGNELWDYPVKADYHSLLLGAHDAFLSKYGQKSQGNWKMRLVAGAFQAYRDGNCISFLRDFSNCGGDLERHDFIGDYLDIAECDFLRDLDAIDCHPYSFTSGTTQWTHPEDPESEAWQIRNQAAWLLANRDPVSGILRDTRMWSSEYGFDSHGVGEKTQSAYLIRGLMMHSRYHYEKVFFYNAYDVARPTDGNYGTLYSSSGFWRQGQNGVWPSPLEAHGASPKPSWFGMLDLKNRFGSHVFYKALVEDADAQVIIIAKPDGSDPYLVFWSPQHTNDANINLDIPVMRQVNWSSVFANGFTADGVNAQVFAENNAAGGFFSAVSDPMCGSLKLHTIRRNPAFIRLKSCIACPNITDPGTIVLPNPSMGGSPFDPATIANGLDASGGTGGQVEYQWQQSIDNNFFTDIPGATSASYNPPSLTQTTYFRRAAKRSTCTEYVYGSSVVIAVGSTCPIITNFKRSAHAMSGCNPGGDFFYEITLSQISMNEQVTLSGLPNGGINIPLSLLNNSPLNVGSFQTNLSYVNNTSLQWQVNAANGATQTLRLTYCWANTYPNVGNTTASSLCSGQTTPCSAGFNNPNQAGDEREGDVFSSNSTLEFDFKLAPNPGTDHLQVFYEGLSASEAVLRMMNATGQMLMERNYSDLDAQNSWEINTAQLSAGIYFISLQTGKGIEWAIWEKI
jgi:hypothetical protein